MAEIALATPDFDRILRDTGVANADAIRVIWLLLQDEINRRERLSQSVGGTTGHNLLSATHPDTIPDSPVVGDLIQALGSSPIDSSAYFHDGEMISFTQANADTQGVGYFHDGDAFVLGGFGLTSGAGTKWQRFPIAGSAGKFLGSDGVTAQWTAVATASESASVFGSIDQAIASATDTAINWSNISFDTATFWNSVTPSRLTVPTGKAGKYLVVGQLYWADSEIGSFHAKIRKGGSTLLAEAASNSTISGVSNAPGPHQVAWIGELAQGDYVELVAYWSYTDAVPRNVIAGAAVTTLHLVKVG